MEVKKRKYRNTQRKGVHEMKNVINELAVLITRNKIYIRKETVNELRRTIEKIEKGASK